MCQVGTAVITGLAPCDDGWNNTIQDRHSKSAGETGKYVEAVLPVHSEKSTMYVNLVRASFIGADEMSMDTWLLYTVIVAGACSTPASTQGQAVELYARNEAHGE
ncbi:MAG: hypothetical protein NVS4B8_03650 [Herpetosiphon sp.]